MTKETKNVEAETPEVETKLKEEVAPKTNKKISDLADQTSKGKHGTGRERMLALGENYEDVQAELRQRSIRK